MEYTHLPVAKVLSVSVRVDEGTPPVFVLEAVGEVAGSGWSEPQLQVAKYVEPPRDGIYEYVFFARPPGQDTGDSTSHVKAEYRWENPSDWLKGVCVEGRDNKIVAIL